MSKLVRVIQACLLAGFAILPALRAQQTVQVPVELVSYPDIIYHNGKIATLDDPGVNSNVGRFVEAVAIRGEKIQFVGSNAEVLRMAGPNTKKVDLKGYLMTPGLINTHTHLHDSLVNGWAERNPEKTEAIRKSFTVSGKTNEEITKGIELVVKEQMAHPLPGQWAWISLGGGGTGIGIKYLEDKVMTREQLNALAPQLPVFVGAHPEFLWNDAARNSFLRWYEVEPTDENEEKAITIDTTMGRSLIADFYFDSHMDELANVLEEGLSWQAAGGFTTFSSHIVGLRKMPAYTQLVREGRLPVRFAFSNRYCQQIEVDIPGCFLRAGDYAGMGDPSQFMWNVGITLGGIDNGPPAICTTMEAAPADKAREDCIIQPGNDYWRAVYAAVRSRYRYVVNHSWGDGGIEYVLDIIDQVMKENPEGFTLDFVRSRRYSGDHCGFYPNKNQIPRMARINWHLSCDPGALSRSAPWLSVYGADAANQIGPIKTALAAGIKVGLEEEMGYNLARPDPEIRSMWLAAMPFLTRKTNRGEDIAPQEAIDRNQLIKMATTYAASYVMREDFIGSIEPGKLADLVVWNKDYFTVPQEELGGVYPVMTILGGKTLVLRNEYAQVLGTQPIGHQPRFRTTPGGGGGFGGGGD
jgi:predicted amidohydrolase YtcJ